MNDLLKSHVEIKKIWETLARHAPETVWVGGGVRNLYLGLTPTDFDLATPLVPEEIIEIARSEGWRSDEVGASFGVVVVVYKGVQVEVATFRKEGYEGDPHRPSWVEYGVSLKEDLGRRDFTMNGMALTLAGEWIDPFDGRKDLDRKLIRAIGDPATRFREDALRILRGIRFAGTFNFEIEDQTEKEIVKSAPKVAELSEERIVNELEKILLNSYSETSWKLLDRLQVGAVIFSERWKYQEDCKLDQLPKELILRWGCVARILGEDALSLKGLNQKIVRGARWIAKESHVPWEGMRTLQRWSAQFRNLKELLPFIVHWRNFCLVMEPRLIRGMVIDEVIEMTQIIPLFTGDLKITGTEVAQEIGGGPRVGIALKDLLTKVQEGQVFNEPHSLRKYLKRVED